MIDISTTAQKYFNKLLLKKTKDTHIRVFVTHPGTIMAECGVSYCNKKDVKKNDMEIKYNHFNVYIDSKSVPYLKNAKIDLVIEDMNSCLTLKAPFAKSYKNNKYSVLIDQIKLFLDDEVNPYLYSHGGKITLIDITESAHLIVKFSGGCNGCAMISTTLKDSIEKKILIVFPEIKGIIDSTEHQRGNHSYY